MPYIDIEVRDFLVSEVKKSVNEHLSSGIKSLIETAVKKRAEAELDGIKSDIEKSVDDFVKEAATHIMGKKIEALFKSNVSELVSDEMGKMNQKIKNIKDIVDSLKLSSSAYLLSLRVDEIAKLVGSITANITQIKSDISSLSKKEGSEISKKYDGNEIKDLWKSSGVQLKEIMAIFNVEQTQAHRYATGNIQDPIVRLKLKRLFASRIEEAKNGGL